MEAVCNCRLLLVTNCISFQSGLSFVKPELSGLVLLIDLEEVGVAVGAIVGTLNHMLHEKSDPEDMQLTNKIRKAVGNSKAVQIVEKNVINDDGVVNKVLLILDNAGNKLAEISLKAINLVKFMVDYIAPVTNKSLEDEYLFNKIHSVPFSYEPGQNSNGYMDKYGNWHSTK